MLERSIGSQVEKSRQEPLEAQFVPDSHIGRTFLKRAPLRFIHIYDTRLVLFFDSSESHDVKPKEKKYSLV